MRARILELFLSEAEPENSAWEITTADPAPAKNRFTKGSNRMMEVKRPRFTG
jgi:hypothetical protein